MRIIAFQYTAHCVLNKTKTVTRRRWVDSYGERFRSGEICVAYDKSPRIGGKPIAFIQLTKKPFKQRLYKIDRKELKREGGLWTDANLYIKLTFPDLCRYDKVWVVNFKLIKKIRRHK